MSKFRSVMIDSDKLREELFSTGKTLQEISTSIGYHADYLSGVVGSGKKSGYISNQAIVALKIMYGIESDSYKHIDKSTEMTNDGNATSDCDKVSSEEIYATVRKAVNDEMRIFLQHGARRRLDDKEIKRNFDVVKCVTSGDGFTAGELYAMLGWNNGNHILREDKRGEIYEFLAYDGGIGDGELNNPDETGIPSFTRYIFRNGGDH